MTVYSTNFYSGTVPAGTTSLYTVPAGLTVVIRDVRLYGNVASATPISLGLQRSGASTAIYLYANPLNPGALVVEQGRAVLEAGDVIASNAGAGGALIWVSGYLLG